MSGKFVVSLDFELFWGNPEKRRIRDGDLTIKEVHTVIPKLLEVFRKYEIHATFSTVGFLFFKDKNELLMHLPKVRPTYVEPYFSPYGEYLNYVGENFSQDPYHFGSHLVEKIREYPEQEIGSHTFCHFQCLEQGQTAEQFHHDLQHALLVSEQKGIQLTSLVFPQNQVNENYLEICKNLGIICYRGNPPSKFSSWLLEARRYGNDGLLRRGLRFLDTYINLSGHNAHDLTKIPHNHLINIPASRFLRPHNQRLTFLDGLRLHRICFDMTYAAKNNLVYHLWWHPHNFGIHQDENFGFLEKVLQHYQKLRETYNFQSITMSNLATELLADGVKMSS